MKWRGRRRESREGVGGEHDIDVWCAAVWDENGKIKRLET